MNIIINELSHKHRFNKKIFDRSLAATGLILTWWLILLAALLATFDTKANGFFTQERVGKDGKLFKVIKIRTMRSSNKVNTTVTTNNDSRITSLGKLLRKTKIDELPQLVNVLFGQMSFVGPRPDVPGFADELKEEDKVILTLCPGITGPATIYYRNEEDLLTEQSDPEKYNKEVIYPHKIELNKKYIMEYSLLKDIQYIIKTVLK